MILNIKEILKIAHENSFAIGAFNICDSLLFKTVIEAAEENNSPVIVQLAPPEFNYVGEDFFKYVVSRLEKSKVPCVLHLDHGKTIEDCKKAIKCGFTSVMIDGSLLPYEENVELTKKVVDIAKIFDVSVEAEIGTIGALSDSVEGGVENITYTKPEEVLDFMNKTNADSLAIAIGTAHGIYPKNLIPKLRLDILREISKLCSYPLVLHGGSGNRDEEIAEACKLGINKVNIASDYRKVFFDTTKEVLVEKSYFWTPRVYEKAIEEAKKVITHKMELFGCIGKADLYR